MSSQNQHHVELQISQAGIDCLATKSNLAPVARQIGAACAHRSSGRAAVTDCALAVACAGLAVRFGRGADRISTGVRTVQSICARSIWTRCARTWNGFARTFRRSDRSTAATFAVGTHAFVVLIACAVERDGCLERICTTLGEKHSFGSIRERR